MVFAKRKSMANIPQSPHKSLVEPRICRLTNDGFDFPDGSDLIHKTHASEKCLKLRIGAGVSINNRKVTGRASREGVIDSTNVDWRSPQIRIPPRFPSRCELGPPSRIDGQQLPSTDFYLTVMPSPDSICESVDTRRLTQTQVSPTSVAVHVTELDLKKLALGCCGSNGRFFDVVAQATLGARCLIHVDNLFGSSLIQQLAKINVLSLGFVKILAFNSFSQLLDCCL
jgi:hypothetical protein